MNIVNFMKEDVVNSTDGICMSIWFSGCDIHCDGCHNQSYWEPVDNSEFTPSRLAWLVEKEYEDAKEEYGIIKSLSILGGEPLALFNRKDLKLFLHELRVFIEYPYIRLWTGRTKEQLLEESEADADICQVLSSVNEIIVGPFIKSLKKDLPLRGSSNQEILRYGEDFGVSNSKLYFKS